MGSWGQLPTHPEFPEERSGTKERLLGREAHCSVSGAGTTGDHPGEDRIRSNPNTHTGLTPHGPGASLQRVKPSKPQRAAGELHFSREQRKGC